MLCHPPFAAHSVSVTMPHNAVPSRPALHFAALGAGKKIDPRRCSQKQIPAATTAAGIESHCPATKGQTANPRCARNPLLPPAAQCRQSEQ